MRVVSELSRSFSASSRASTRRCNGVSAATVSGRDSAWRVAMSLTGLYPTESLKQIFAIVTGTSIVAAFAVYLRLKWSAFA